MRRRDLTSETAPDAFDVQAEAEARGIQAYQVRASRVVNNRLMQDIVNDFRSGPSQPSSLAVRPRDSAPEPVKGNGWRDAPPLRGPDVRWCDAQLDAQDRRDRAALIRQQVETAWIESHFEKGPRIEHEYNPFDAEHMKK